MATSIPCLAQMSRLSIRSSLSARHSARFISTTVSRCAAAKTTKSVGQRGQNPQKNKKKGAELKKKKARTTFKEYDMRDATMFSLCDAMRYDVSSTFEAFADYSDTLKLSKLGTCQQRSNTS